MNHPIIAADQLTLSIKESKILDGLSFEVEAGTLTGIIGPNGSGKTTLLKAISGLLPFQGALTFQGKPVVDWDPRLLAQHLAVLPQNPTIAFDFEVRDYVMLGRMPHKGWLETENAKDQDVVRQVLEDLDLKDLHARTIPSLSGGERQRVLLAQALVQNTSVLLLDEPTAHLDIYHQFDLLKRIRRLVDEGRTMLVVFHDLNLAARFTDALIVLNKGRMVDHGKTEDVLDASMIADVFRMSATLHTAPDGALQIYYKAMTNH